jgi:hypothetical protein
VGDGTRHHDGCASRVAVSWTADRVLALAPDAASAKSGRDLANRKKWRSVAQLQADAGGPLLWGECQGSGKDPYLTRIDTAEPAFKCSCPSRKFPCKHALGLFLLYVQSPNDFPSEQPPAWVAEWLESRSAKAERRAAREASPSAPDPAAQAKRIADREQRVAAGLAELERWLSDLVRQGLSNVPMRSAASWENMAARLVDAQAAGAARLVRQLPGVIASGEGWPERLLARLARLQLLIDAYGRQDSLPSDLAAEVRSQVGWTTAQETLLEEEGVVDQWTVLGRRVTEDDRLRMQRTWLWGASSQRPALILEFGPARLVDREAPPLDASLTPGATFEGTLVYFPAAYPLRALVKERGETIDTVPATGFGSLREAIAANADAVARSPWLERFPMLLRDVTPIVATPRWRIRDSLGTWLPLVREFEARWPLLAVSGGHPTLLFGEWDGAALRPLSAWIDGTAVDFA